MTLETAAIAISGKTQLVGLLGWPVAHSLSPVMHNAAAAQLGLDLAYVPLPTPPDKVAQAVRGLVALGFRGANVTVPHKEAIIPLLDQVDEAAAAIGAVNTIVVEHQPPAVSRRRPPASPSPPPSSYAATYGHNTDWSGFMAELQALALDVSDRDTLLLGAGGSARAVAYGLASAGSRVHLFARRLEQARQVVSSLADHCPAGSLMANDWAALGDSRALFASTVLVVNTTPVGMAPNLDASPWPEMLPFPEEAFVYDLVYNPAETRFMQQARAAGRQTSNGLGMLLRQGALAFQLWTGLEPDLQVMAKALGAL